MILQTLGVLIQGAGITILFLHWRGKRSHGGGFLVAGWGLVILGAAPWFMSVSPERALALGALAPMALGLLFLAPDALPRLSADAARKKTKPTPEADDNDVAPPGRKTRNAGRLFASLVAAPLLALAAAGAYQVFVPGSIADRTVFSGFVAIAVWAAAALWFLATQKPWRASLIACAAATILAAGTFMIATQGAA